MIRRWRKKLLQKPAVTEAAQQDQANTKAQRAEIREILHDTTTRLNALLSRLRARAETPPPPLRLVRK